MTKTTWLTPYKSRIPNWITVSRLILVLIAFTLLLFKLYWFSLFVSLISAFSDFLDGYLARRWKVISDFGARYDPLIDKVGVLSALAFFVWLYKLSILNFLIIVVREVMITVIREKQYVEGKKLPADIYGKIKTNLQFGLILLCYVVALYPNVLDLVWVEISLAVVTAWTAWSGLNYLHILSKK
jgi:CDP-diacylglycerol---glycerol-3-phosphate 3-phosphatidyltransferase